jgi:uncharacterized membrane protein
VAFYLSAFGAWRVWQLVPYGAAFAVCVLTTAFAFAAAVPLRAQWLALLGVVGGYVTPFMLFSPTPTCQSWSSPTPYCCSVAI